MKNLEIMKQYKGTLLTFFFAPALVLCAVGFIFCKIYVENIPFGIADLDNSSLSRTIVRQFKNHPGLKVMLYANSEKELADAVTAKKVCGGIVIPKNFYRDVLEGKSPRALVLIDGTNLVIGNSVQGYCSAITGTLSAGMQLSILEGRGLNPAQATRAITSFAFSDRVLYDPTLCYQKYLIHMVYLFVIQMIFFANFLIPLFVEKKSELHRVGVKSQAGANIIKETFTLILTAIVVLCVSTYLGLLAGNAILAIPVSGELIEHVVLIGVFLFDLTAMAIFVASIVKDTGYFQEIYSSFSLVFILTSGIPWPEYLMPKGLPLCIQALWPMFNVTYVFKALHMKTVGWNLVLPHVGQGFAFALFWGTIGTYLYYRKLTNAEHTMPLAFGPGHSSEPVKAEPGHAATKSS